MIVTVWAMNLVEMQETFAELDLEISHRPQNVRAERTPEREKINRNLWQCAGDGRMMLASPVKKRMLTCIRVQYGVLLWEYGGSMLLRPARRGRGWSCSVPAARRLSRVAIVQPEAWSSRRWLA